MTRINEADRNLLEQAIYLPMIIIILERDLKIIEKSPFKIKQPYITLMENTIKNVQRDLKEVKDKLRKENMRVNQIGHDESFTMYEFHYKGYDEQHSYFNPRIRNKCEELFNFYLNSPS
ncbi:hypothetical protein [Cytobacillus kochii]|uniref:hypothetical protein n=1 Tax=Cytobacillus kochii TaxID=859143 RepID=UPI00203A9D36|nr:hypothetical protein [Cytobacillus kochii]MCM3324223.1 hypothetical protein [Cytobacillus kochii]MCM3346708.1 hypothetical protein [Cytobacillus kochii]